MKKFVKKSNDISIDQYIKGIEKRDRVLLAQAITLVESNAKQHFEKAQKIIEALLQNKNSSIRIGITGVPGAGKSTFIDSFGTYLCEQGYYVAVLAIDPSSQVSKGSIMGDKTRMERLSRHPNAYIRPSPSGGNLGGVSRKTRETIILCEAAGYNIILVETMGVGQGEFVVREMVDFFLLLVLTGAGDELQTMKKGIMELPDLVVVNKADGENMMKANKAKSEYNSILHFLSSYTKDWETRAVTASSIEETGIADIWEIIKTFEKQTKKSNLFYKRRTEQQLNWLHDLVKQEVYRHFYEHPLIKDKLNLAEQTVKTGSKHVSRTALELVNLFIEHKH
ncbi:methylmalonyl Co-A mutase-associated GTPase MeaB [Metabacillus schmidteae]|uniref:methylmalonyl Co-A mutase-associated GTPase MeaB n=1 Tax=Metabacillus schmidteae TaxID=2730405 RepID=UPI00158A5C0B|nr:methylmalonyl Co-A mutase-associated GTPase MeaB [Metabacillus schmidteae]